MRAGVDTVQAWGALTHRSETGTDRPQIAMCEMGPRSVRTAQGAGSDGLTAASGAGNTLDAGEL